MIKIDNIEFPPVILAPLSGITDLPFRDLVKRFIKCLTISEMIASPTVIIQAKKMLKMAQKSNDGAPTAIQLAGRDSKIMAEAAKICVDLGADIIDINFGCPAKKVVNGFAGSALMQNECLAKEILEEVAKAVKIPVTLKMRMGWNHENLNACNIAKFAENAGIKMITIHGRTRSQMFSGKANWEFISSVKEVVKIPVIANGDIKNIDDAREALSLSKADGVMIGRGSYGKPYIISEITSKLKNEEFKKPSLEEQRDMVLEHFEQILSCYGEENGTQIAKKHIAWYSSGFIGSNEYRAKVNLMNDHTAMKREITEFYDRQLDKNYIYEG